MIEENLKPLISACSQYQPKTLIGSSGTFDTLSDIYCIAENIVASEEATELPLTVLGFEAIFKKLISMNREQRLQLPGMIEMRVDMIVVASVLVKYIVDKVGIEQMRVSSYALKEGILMKTIDSFAV